MFKVGVKFEVIGFVMLKNLDGGCRYIVTQNNNGIVQFAKLLKNGKKSKKEYAHYLIKLISSVECSERCQNHIRII